MDVNKNQDVNRSTTTRWPTITCAMCRSTKSTAFLSLRQLIQRTANRRWRIYRDQVSGILDLLEEPVGPLFKKEGVKNQIMFVEAHGPAGGL